jgi:hypothetical protein
LHHPSGSTAITVVAVPMRAASVSNAVVNLIIVSAHDPFGILYLDDQGGGKRRGGGIGWKILRS